ncbi:reverse transcriptase domain-containing protein [Tanacetum coccineum]
MTTAKYCPRNEIKKLEMEIWELKVKGTDFASYTQRFQELALLCGRMFPEESNKIEKYVGGLPDMIHGSVMVSKSKTMQDVIEFTTELIDKKINTFAERQAKNKRKIDHTSRNNQNQQQPPKRHNVAQAYTAGPGASANALLLTNKGHSTGQSESYLTLSADPDISRDKPELQRCHGNVSSKQLFMAKSLFDTGAVEEFYKSSYILGKETLIDRGEEKTGETRRILNSTRALKRRSTMLVPDVFFYPQVLVTSLFASNHGLLILNMSFEVIVFGCTYTHLGIMMGMDGSAASLYVNTANLKVNAAIGSFVLPMVVTAARLKAITTARKSQVKGKFVSFMEDQDLKMKIAED